MDNRMFRLLHIVSAEAESSYPPIYARDSAEFPQFQDEIEDESVLIAYEESTGLWCPAGEFFDMNKVVSFTAEMPDDADPNFTFPRR